MTGTVLWRAAIVVLFCAVPASAEVLHCPGRLADVTAANPGDAAVVCRAAEEGAAQLAACDLTPKRAVRVRVLDELPEECPEHALAYFDARQRIVTVPTYTECARLAGPSGRWGVPMTPALYRSLIVHELTHAVASQNAGPDIGRAVHEYVAYAIQFESMDPNLRRRILAQYPHPDPIRLNELSETYFDLSPARFAVKVHLHFRGSEARCPFLHQLLQGERKLPSGMR